VAPWAAPAPEARGRALTPAVKTSPTGHPHPDWLLEALPTLDYSCRRVWPTAGQVIQAVRGQMSSTNRSPLCCCARFCEPGVAALAAAAAAAGAAGLAAAAALQLQQLQRSRSGPSSWRTKQRDPPCWSAAFQRLSSCSGSWFDLVSAAVTRCLAPRSSLPPLATPMVAWRTMRRRQSSCLCPAER